MADQVEVISTSTVKMANPHQIFRVDLTPWDLKLLTMSPIQKGLFFSKPPSQESQKPFIDHLKDSLSLALDFFPPLAGRLAKNNNNNTTDFFVDCNNAGASFTHAIARGVHIHEVLDPIYIPTIVHSFFSVKEVINYNGLTNPLLGVQVTELVDSYFIACTMNHCVGDGTSFWHFFNSWSEISRGSSILSRPPLYDRSSIKEFSSINFPVPVPPFEPISHPDQVLPPSYAERIFHFRKDSLSKLKAQANSEAGTNTISTLQSLLAHTWRAMVRSRGVVELDQQLICVLLIGTRQRLPLPDAYFGNAFYASIVSVKSKDLVHKGLGWVALEMNKVVSAQTKEQVLQEIGKELEFIIIHPEVQKQVVLIGSTPRHNMFGVDFGWGKPVAVRSGSDGKFDGKISLYPSREDGAIDVEVCLGEESLVAMGNDTEFMETLTTF